MVLQKLATIAASIDAHAQTDIKKARPWTDEYPYCDEYRRCEKLKIKMGLNYL